MWGKLKTQFHNVIAFWCLLDKSHFQVARHLKKLRIWLDVFWGI